MQQYSKIGFGGTALLAAVCVLIFAVVRYNLAAASAAIAQIPATVIIDAGHGGEDGGATGITGASESQINLEIALRLEQLLSFCGLDTLMIRTTDTAVYTGDCNTFSEKKVSDLKNRTALVNRTPSAILISIHQNHFSQSKYSGAQVFYSKNFSDECSGLAQSIQESIVYFTQPKNKREIKPCGTSVYLIYNAVKPAVLVECGFLSNKEEAEKLKTEEYQKQIAFSIATGILNYYEGQ